MPPTESGLRSLIVVGLTSNGGDHARWFCTFNETGPRGLVSVCTRALVRALLPPVEEDVSRVPARPRVVIFQCPSASASACCGQTSGDARGGNLSNARRGSQKRALVGWSRVSR